MFSTRTLLAATALVVALIGPAPASAGSRPDDRAVGPRSAAVVDAVRPDDRAGYRGPGAIVDQLPTATSTSAFDFGDAAIGAATAVGFLLFAAGLTLVVMRRRARLA